MYGNLVELSVYYGTALFAFIAILSIIKQSRYFGVYLLVGYVIGILTSTAAIYFAGLQDEYDNGPLPLVIIFAYYGAGVGFVVVTLKTAYRHIKSALSANIHD